MFTKEQLLNCISKTPKSSFVPVENLKEEVIQNALNNFAKGCRREDVVAIYDFTIMENGKKGYLLATDGLYGYDFHSLKRHTSDITKIPFEGLKEFYSLKNGSIEVGKSIGIGDFLYKFIYEDGSSIVIFLPSVNAKEVFPVMDSILNLIHSQDKSETSDSMISEEPEGKL